MDIPMPSPTCPICLDLTPNHLPTTPWRFNVTENMLVESCLRFKVSDLEASSRTCIFCSVILEGLEALSHGVLQDELIRLRSRDGSFIVQKNLPLEVEIFSEDVSAKNPPRIQFFEQQDNRAPNVVAFGTANLIVPSISSKSHCHLIQSWIKHCLQSHEACAPRLETRLPTRLLDIAPRLDLSVILIESTDLVNLPTTPLYATLSYCWGVKEFLRTMPSNILQFKQFISFDALPGTFKDAISVARELGIRYIWIDSLCIIQDSQEDWKNESALMASVYSNSYLNIAATAAGDSSQTFLSTRDITCNSVSVRPRFFEVTEPADRSWIMARPALTQVHKLYSTPSQNANSTPWAAIGAQLLSRAWAFQERYLAPRTLHFHHSELVLECRAGLRCECTGLDHFDSNPLRNFDDLSFASWYGVVEAFSKLRLTYQSDRLEALTGVAEVFWKKLGCSYMKGLWSDDMAKGLLWDVTHLGRHTVPYTAARRQSKVVAPTWSWASLVLAEPNKIFFPAGESGSFCVDERFKFLGADPPASLPSTNFQSQSGAIRINCRFVDAILGLIADEDETTPIAVALFQEDIDDMVLIARQTFAMDIERQLTMTPCREASCLLLGSAEEKWDKEIPSITVFHMLVVEPSTEIEGSWERVGVLNLKEGAEVCRGLNEKIFRLV